MNKRRFKAESGSDHVTRCATAPPPAALTHFHCSCRGPVTPGPELKRVDYLKRQCLRSKRKREMYASNEGGSSINHVVAYWGDLQK